MLQTVKGKSIAFAALEAFYWASYCVLYAFITTILTANGYSKTMCGVVTSLLAVFTVIVQPLLGHLADSILPSKKLLLILFGIAIPLSALLPWAIHLPIPLAVGYIVLLSLFDFSQHSLIDSWAIQTINKTPGMEFSLIRSGASISYAVAALVMGNLAVYLGVEIFLWSHVVFLVASLLSCLLLEEQECLNHRQKGKDSSSGMLASIRLLLTNKIYVTVIVSLTLYHMGLRITNTYMPLIIEMIGGNSGHYGILTFIGAGGEVIFMVLVARMLQRGYPISKAFLIALGAQVLRILLLVTQNIWLYIATQIIQSLSYGIYLRVFMEYIRRLIEPRLVATATTFGVAATNGLGSVIGNAAGGVILENLGLDTYIILSALLILLGMVVFLPVYRAEQEEQRQNI